MDRKCDICGRAVGGEDFLCPYCGAILGEKRKQPPGQPSPEAEPVPVQTAAEPAAEVPAEKKKLPRWVLPVSAGCLILAFLLVLIGPELKLWAGEGTAGPSGQHSTNIAPTLDRNPDDPTLKKKTYTVTFVDPFGNPIEGVGIYNLRNDLWSSMLYPSVTYSDSSGTASFVLYDMFYTKPYVQIRSVPDGYDSRMEDSIVWYDEGKTHMQLVLIPLLDGVDEVPPTTAVPPETLGPVTTQPIIQLTKDYTVRVVDEEGDPVPGVHIESGYVYVSSFQSDSAVTDEKGQAILTLLPAWASVRITSVPEGYSDRLVGVEHRFPEGQTEMKLVLVRNGGSGGVDIPLPGTSYPVTMDDTEWLIEPLPIYAQPGTTVTVKLLYEPDACIMLFANGAEITDPQLILRFGGPSYLQYEFIMPGQPVELKVRAYRFENGNEAAEEFFQTWYRQNPNAPDTSFVDYYGHYGQDGAYPVVMLETSRDDAVVIESAAGYEFWYYSGECIQVLASGEILSLRTAYEQDILPEEDIRQIYQMYVDRYFPLVFG